MSRTNLVIFWAAIITIIVAISMRLTNPELVIYVWIAFAAFAGIAKFPRLLLPLVKSIVAYLVMIYLIVPYMTDWGHWFLNYLRIGVLALVYIAFIIFVCYSFAVRVNTPYIKTKKFVMGVAILVGITLMVTGNLFDLFLSNKGGIDGGKGWKTVLVDDGLTWVTPKDPSKTTEWLDISRWNVKFRYKTPEQIMEFKTRDGDIVAIKVMESGNYLNGQKWSKEEYEKTFHNSTHIRFTPTIADLDLRVGRRSW